MKQLDFDLAGKPAHGVEVPLPGAPLVVAYHGAGFVMCGYLDLATADKLNVAAAVVRGVATVDDLLKANVQGVSKAAAARGVTVGMTGRDALSRLA